MASSALPQQIIDALASGTTVLTANQRAARTLQHNYNLRCRALGKISWEPPAILAWEAWLVSLWRQLLLAGATGNLLLNSTQEHSLWRDIIAADATHSGLQSVDSLARTSAEAWLILHQHRCRDRIGAYPGNSDTRTFITWAADFDRRCRRAKYTTQAQLSEALSSAVASGSLTLPNSLLLVGFDSKTPAQIDLIDVLRSSATRVAEPEPAPPTSALILADAPDDAAEIAACAKWLRGHLMQDPAASIAVIVPDIDACRAEIDRQFRHTLAPELENISAPIGTEPYEFSLGIPLARTPLVAAQLDTLRWAISALPIERVSALLLSPHFAAVAAADEMLARAEFDAFALRQQHLLEPSLTLQQLLHLVSHSKFADRLPGLLKHLRQLVPHAARRNISSILRSCSEWADMFHDFLDAAGFGTQANLDSSQFQMRRKWENALDELTTLDFDAELPPLSFPVVLEALTRIADDTLFAPESRHAPVQIMGPLESAGSDFDAVWFLRANNLTWPATSSTNPLLSWLLQHEYNMPGADPAHDTSHARRVTRRIAGIAPVIVFSYARQSGEERQRPASVLPETLAFTRTAAAELAPLFESHRHIELEPWIDDAAIPSPPDSVLRGGSAILLAQAACGFRAFAERRLSSTALDSVSLGLDAAERGSLVHAVLEDFWATVRTQENLKAMAPAERGEQLSRSIELALSKHHSRPASGWPSAYIEAERQRLKKILSQFLHYEVTERRPFAVEAREKQLSAVSIGPLKIDVRVDRIDSVDLLADDGTTTSGEIIIDYKTGAANPADWQDERPNAPQLPLYAVVSGSISLAAVAFATIRPGKDMGLRGYEAAPGILPRSSKMAAPTLAAQVVDWRRVLEALAYDFYNGCADASPKKYPKTCAYCAQRLLCRLDLTSLNADSLEDEVDFNLPVEFNGG